MNKLIIDVANEKIFLMIITFNNNYNTTYENTKTNYEKLTIIINDFLDAYSLKISDILYTYVLGNTQKTQELKLNKKDFSFCIELPIKAKKNNYKLKSTPSHERKRIGGEKKVNAFRDGFKILISMMILFLF